MASTTKRSGLLRAIWTPEPLPKPTNPQEESPLFTTLPPEIRRNIYRQLWLDLGLTQHLYAMTEKSYLMRFPCILSPEELNRDPRPSSTPADVPDDAAGADDNGDAEQPESHDDPGDIDGALQEVYSDDPSIADTTEPANSTPWCTHFACFRNNSRKWGHSFVKMYSACFRAWSKGPPDLRKSPILTAFLVCKRVYAEASESLYSEMSFSFATMLSMDIFLSEVPRALSSRIQSVYVMTGNMGSRPLNCLPIDSRPPAQEAYDKLRASFPKLRELRLALHPRRPGETIPQKQDLEPLYELTHELDNLRRFEVFLPTKCVDGGKVGYGDVPVSLQDAPFTVKVVPHGWHEDSEEGPHYHST